MINPLDAIREWHSRLPQRIAGLVADRMLTALGKNLAQFPDPQTAGQQLYDWLSDYGDNPTHIVAKAGMFRTVFTILLADSFDPETWKRRQELLDGFLEQHRDSEKTRQWRRQQEFETAQWRAQENAWHQLVEDHLSDEALRQYLDDALHGSLD